MNHVTSNARLTVTFRPVRDSNGNITLQPLDEPAARAESFRRQIEQWIARAKEETDPIRVWFNIGPIEASVLLEFSKGNRNESAGTVAMYVRDIEHGAWKKTHQGFGFSRSGWLGDGHHRCLAVQASGKTVRVCIDFGVDDDAFGAVDMGRGRNISDQLALKRGMKNSKKVVAAVRVAMALTEGAKHMPKRSLAEVEEGFGAHMRAIKALSKLSSNKFPASFWGTLLYAYPAAPESIEALADKVMQGEGITGAAYTLREYLLHAGRAEPIDIAQRTLYAVRAFIEGRPLAKFAPRSDSAIFEWAAAKVAKIAKAA